jgi:Rieske 2Fe-2S family protein
MGAARSAGGQNDLLNGKGYSSWIVRDNAVEAEDYYVTHLTDVWKVTNAEDVGLCMSMKSGARSTHY